MKETERPSHIIEHSQEEYEQALAMGIGEHPGYLGMFTRAQAEGAIPNGARFKKVWGEEGNGHALGAEGVVLGSLAVPPGEGDVDCKIGYFVEWDDNPRCAVFVSDKKIAPL